MQPKTKHRYGEFSANLANTLLDELLDEDDREALFTHNPVINFSDNTVILQQGRVTEGLYLILQGYVEVLARIMGQGDTIMGLLNEGNFVGEVSFIEKGPSTTTAIAKGDVTCLFLSHSFFALLANYYPELRYKLLRALTLQVCHRLKMTHDRVIKLISFSNRFNQSFFGNVIHTFTQPREVSPEEVEDYALIKNNFLASLSSSERDYLLNHVILLDAPKNCVLIQEAEKGASCYFVLRGAVQTSIMHENKLAKLSVIGPESLFAGVACIDKDSEFTITFITCERAILMKIDELTLECIQKENHLLWYKLFSLITTSLVALRKSIDKLDVRLHIETYNR